MYKLLFTKVRKQHNLYFLGQFLELVLLQEIREIMKTLFVIIGLLVGINVFGQKGNDFLDNTGILQPFKEKNLNIQDFHLIFSAHGLPESIVKNGDPYQKQTEKTYELIISEFPIFNSTSFSTIIGCLKIFPANSCLVPIPFSSRYSTSCCLLNLSLGFTEIK